MLRHGDDMDHHHLGVSGFATYAVVDQRSVVAVVGLGEWACLPS